MPLTRQSHCPVFTPFIPVTTRHPTFRLASFRCPSPHKHSASSVCVASASISQHETSQYVPLHVHSDFSLLDGASQLPSLVRRAADLGVPALALTDHGVLYGAIQLVRQCEPTDVKPIIGNEMYIVNDVPHHQTDPTSGPPKKYHLIVLARNTVGYRNLVQLTSMAHMNGKVGKGIFARPCINKAQLFQHREGLIVSSACLGGEIPQAILNDDETAAREVAMWYRDVFGDDFYLEIQDHGSTEDKKVNPVIVRLSEELGINVIATNDSHFTSCLDAEAHDALICIQTGKLLSDENRLHYAGNEFFKSVEEMRECFIDHLPLDSVNRALYNTLDVARKVEKYHLFGATRIPDFPLPESFSGSMNNYLREVSHKSLKDRLQTRIRSGLVDASAESSYFELLERELDMICKMGFSSYFLVVWDYIRHAKELNIPVGPGRGSAAGSLVAFALRITDVDPISFNLLFERFLNPERKSMPDIDTDFSVTGREQIIQYVNDRYGADRVAQIITFNRLTSKAVLKDVARVHSVPYAEADRLAKLIPVVRGKPATLTKLLSKDTPSPEFKKAIDKNSSYHSWLDKAKRIEGANKTYGIHAAGVVISASPLTDFVPLSKGKHGETITQYAMEDVEALGLLKMDFLGLKNLTVIEISLEFINAGRKQEGIEEPLDFSVDALPLDDEKTYRLLAEGDLDGIFQLDASGGMRNVVRELRPTSLEDISSILALYRPGPLDAGLIPKFIRRKHGVDPIEYDHPLLEPILKETYGIMVYQEQIMRIARDLAGYSLGQADILRRAMGKKKTEDMEREKPRFVEGARMRGVTEEKASNLFDMMIKFAEYCFNKSHSTAYAYLTYQTAYLKANYPVEYSAALLRCNMNQSDRLVRYLASTKSLGVKVLPPSINKSDLGFTVDRSNSEGSAVLFGLEAVKAVGATVSDALITEREARGPFHNVIDLIERVNLRVLNKRAMAALIQAGAFDELHVNRKVLLHRFEEILALRRKLRDRRKRKETKGLSEEEDSNLRSQEKLAWEEAEVTLAREAEKEPDFTTLERLTGEKASIGYYASGHPLRDMKDIADALGCSRVEAIVGDVADDANSESLVESSFTETVPDGTEVMILSCVTDLKKMTTAKGKKMAKWIIEDETNRVPGILFPGLYDVAEQEVILPDEPSNGADEISEQTTGTRDVETDCVVKDDARVIVWGKVDRESSGASQVIVDDVQRVEDVSAVIATIPFDFQRPDSINIQILQTVAAKVLDVNLEAPRRGTYIDANGEIKTRRWTKSKPLEERNRIPLVMRRLGEDGSVTASYYAGHALRFPPHCTALMASIQQETGYKVDFVAAVDGIAQSITVEKPSAERVAPVSKLGLSEEGVVEPSTEESAYVKEEYLSVSLPPSPMETCSFSAESDSVLDTTKENHNGRTDPSLDVLVGDEQLSSEPLISIGEVQLTMEEHEDCELGYGRLMGATSRQMSTKEEAALDAIRNPPFHRDSFYNNTFRKPPTLDTFSIHDEYKVWQARSAPMVATSIAGKQPEARSSVDFNNSFGSSGDVEEEFFPDLERNYLLENHHLPESVSTTQETAMEYRIDSNLTEERQENGAQAREMPSLDFDSPTRDHSVADGREHDQFLGLSPAGDDFEKPSPNLRHSQSMSLAEDESTSRSSVHSKEPVDLSEGLVVDYDSAQTAGLLDAICLVAGDVARRDAFCEVTIRAMTEVDMTKLSEDGVSIRITAENIFSGPHNVYVIVSMKEVSPTGKRRRVRSFGPIIVVLHASSMMKSKSSQTKKAKKQIDTAVQRLRLSAACETSTKTVQNDSGVKSRSTTSANAIYSSKSGFVLAERWEKLSKGNPTMGDGGQVLRCMCRAARYCVEKATGDSIPLRVAKLTSLVCQDSSLMNESARTLRIRAHIDGKSFAGIHVQVEANILIQDQRSGNLLATFVISDEGFKKLQAFRVDVDEEALFSGESFENIFNELEQCLTSS